jgi:pimeloyl-ACP methyl ester carboxylesterase
MRVSQLSSLARIIAGGTAGALAVSLLLAGPALASTAARGDAAHPGPVGHPRPAAQPRSAGQQGSAGHRHPIRVGSVTIPPCKVSRLAWCTRINVPLDYRNSAAGHIKLGFQWYPATSGKATGGTILAVQGGPGFPTTDYAADYRGTFLPLLARRNLLLVNLRGTGNSSAFLCQALQDWKAADGIAAYTVDTGKCGRQLNHTRRLPGGGYVHASDLYTTANAARDVALLLRRLQTGKVDFYGDSYGTFFGQVLTARYAKLLRSVTLDAAYPVSQANPFYPPYDSHRAGCLQYLLQPQRRLPSRRSRSLVGADRRPGQVPAPPSGDRPDQDAVRPAGDRACRQLGADPDGQRRRLGQRRLPRA